MKRVTYLALLALSLLIAGCNIGEAKPVIRDAPSIMEGGVRQAPAVARAIDRQTLGAVEANLNSLHVPMSTVQEVLQYLQNGSGAESEESVVNDLIRDLAQEAACDVLTVRLVSGKMPTENERDKIFQDIIKKLPEKVLKALKLQPAQITFRRETQDFFNGLERKANTSDKAYAEQYYSTIVNQSCTHIP